MLKFKLIRVSRTHFVITFLMTSLLLFVLTFMGCRKNVDDPVESVTSHSQKLGAILSSEAEFLTVETVESLDTSKIPSLFRVQGSSHILPNLLPALQQECYSCVGWAVGYATIGYQFNQIDGPFKGSPYFLYNQLNTSKDCYVDVKIIDALNLAKSKGLASINTYGFDKILTGMPHQAAFEEAENWMIDNYYRFDELNHTYIKSFIRRNHPLPFAMNVHYDFTIDGPNPAFKNINGNLIYSTPSGKLLGGHAMTIVGYDDIIGGGSYLIMNSWGSNWGQNGFIWMPYSLFGTLVSKNSTGKPYLFWVVPRDVTTTKNPLSVTATSARLEGRVDAFAGSSYIQRGFCWSKTVKKPTISDHFLTSNGGRGKYNLSINNLEPNTEYYARAYAATGSVDVSYGNVIKFRTSSPYSLSIISGNNQVASPNSNLPIQLTVSVKDSLGNPLSNISVQWSVSSGGGQLNSATSSSDNAGVAINTWKLGSIGQQSVTATLRKSDGTDVVGSPAVFIATFKDPHLLTITGGNNQSSTSSSQLPNPLTVLVTDNSGVPMQNIVVSWSVSAGGGNLSATQTFTNSNGEASTNWTIGSSGTQSAIASVKKADGTNIIGSPAQFTSLLKDPESVTIISGNNQTGASNSNLANPLIVEVKDANGSVMSGVTVTWNVTSGGGQLGTLTSTTNMNGRSSNTWKLGAAGTQTVTATVKKANGTHVSGSPVTFNASFGTMVTETFSSTQPGTYGLSSVTLPSGSWTFSQSLIGGDATDVYYSASRAARLRGNISTDDGFLQSDFGVSGLQKLTFYHSAGNFNDPASSSRSLQVFISKNGGGWTPASGSITTTPGVANLETIMINAAANESVRIKIVNTSGLGNASCTNCRARINVDDVTFYY